METNLICGREGMNILTSCRWPKEKLLCFPSNKVVEQDFIAACNSLRCPHLGCLKKPNANIYITLEAHIQQGWGIINVVVHLPYSSSGAWS